LKPPPSAAASENLRAAGTARGGRPLLRKGSAMTDWTEFAEVTEE
jgi:hypothetical protein